MTHGDTEWDMRRVNLHRIDEFQTTASCVSLVCNKNYREVYDMVHPSQPLSEPRNVRPTPFHSRTRAPGASFTTFAGYEIPSWFENNRELLARYDERIPIKAHSSAARPAGVRRADRRLVSLKGAEHSHG